MTSLHEEGTQESRSIDRRGSLFLRIKSEIPRRRASAFVVGGLGEAARTDFWSGFEQDWDDAAIRAFDKAWTDLIHSGDEQPATPAEFSR